MSEPGFIKNISHAVIQSSDIRRAIEFYRLLGFNVDRIISTDLKNPGDINDLDSLPLNRSEAGEYYCVGMGLGSTDPRTITRLEIMEWKTPKRLPNYADASQHLGLVRLAFSVSGLTDIVDRLKACGHKVDSLETIQLSATLSSIFVHIYDPDGNWLTLMEWVKSKGR